MKQEDIKIALWNILEKIKTRGYDYDPLDDLETIYCNI